MLLPPFSRDFESHLLLEFVPDEKSDTGNNQDSDNDIHLVKILADGIPVIAEDLADISQPSTREASPERYR